MHLNAKNAVSSAYHLQVNGQVERYNKNILARLHHVGASQQRDCKHFSPPWTQAYNTQAHRSTSTTPFSFVLSRHPRGPTTFDNLLDLAADAYHETHPRMISVWLLSRISALLSRVDNRLRSAGRPYKKGVRRTQLYYAFY